MGFYRTSRNLEASLIEHLKTHLVQENWDNINIEKSFSRIYNLQMDENKGMAAICVRASDTNRKKFQIGSESTIREELILLDVFATSDGQRLDLVDFLCDCLQHGFPFYEYQTDKNIITSRIQTGRVRVLSLDDKPVNFGIDKSNLEVQDRYRHLISISVSTGKIEE